MPSLALEGATLYQYDTERFVAVEGEGVTHAHFAHPGDREALVVAVSGGRAEVPTQLLQSPLDIVAWAWDGENTEARAVLPVVGRAKPQGYLYEPTDVETIETLKAWVEAYVTEAMETSGGTVAATDAEVRAVMDGIKGNVGHFINLPALETYNALRDETRVAIDKTKIDALFV